MLFRSQWLLILGGGVMQLPSIRAARELGLSVAVADGNDQAPGIEMADRFFHTDLKDGEALLADARVLAETGRPVSGVFTAGTDFAYMVAWLSQQLTLPGHSYEAALNATEKHRMRAALSAAGVPVPSFESVLDSSPGTLRRALDRLGLPVVVKPVDSMGARGVRKVTTAAELSGAVKTALSLSRSRRAILEAVIPGQELSLDALVWDDRIVVTGVADRHICFEPYFIEIGHTMPTALPDSKRREVEEVFCQGIRALGLSRGAAKGDIFLTPEGPVVGEIAARLSGGYMSGWTYPYASDIDLAKAAIRLALGEEPELPPEPREIRVSRERAVISLPGTIREIRGLTEARNLPGIRELFWKVSPGDAVVFPRNNVEKCGNLIAAADDRSGSVRLIEAALDIIDVRLEAGRRETWDWLFGREIPRSHWAFDPPQEVDGALQELSWELPETPGAISALSVAAFAGQRDWHGRRIEGVRSRLTEEYQLSEIAPGRGGLEALFWWAVIRGSLQGGAFVLDTIREYPDRVRTWLEDIATP